MKRLLLLAAVPLWLVPYPPIQDLPNHLGRIHVLLDLLAGGHAFGGEYAITWLPLPNLLADLCLLPLVAALPAATAGKVFLTAVLFGSGLAMARFLSDAGAPEAAWLALPLVWTWFVFMGFLSFLVSVPLALVAFGYYLRREESSRIRERILFAALATAVYLAHLASFAFLVGAVQIRRMRRRGLRGLFVPEPGFLPAMALWAALALFESGGTGWVSWPPLGEKLLAIANLYRWFSPDLDLLLFAALAGGTAFAARGVRRRWLTASLGLLALFLALPRGALNGYWVDVRVLPFLAVFLLASFTYHARRARVAGIAVLLLVIAWAGVETVRVGKPIGPMIRAADALPAGATVIPMTERADLGATWAWHHLATWTVSRRDTITPYLFAKPFQHPLRPLVERWAPYEEWFLGRGEQPDLDRIARDWDFAWLTGVHPIEEEIRRRGTLFVREGDLRIYRFTKSR